MATAADEPISPELALVCPDLAAAARAALPDRELDAPRRAPGLDPPRERTGASRLPVWAALLVYTATSVATLAAWSLLWIFLVALLTTVPLFF